MSDHGDKIQLGLNGFGRIGRLTFRAVMEKYSDKVQVVMINDPFIKPKMMSYLLMHDSVHGKPNFDIGEHGEDFFTVNGHVIKMSAEENPFKIPWAASGVEFVGETSGKNQSSLGSQGHLHSGASRIIISAPAKDALTPVFCYGVNHKEYNASTMNIVSNASCTTNCLAPLAKVVNDRFGIVEGFMTTVHAMTASQAVVDGTNKKPRLGRAAGRNIIPTTTGAAAALGEVLPSLSGRLTGMAFRVPVENVSVLDLTCRLEHPMNSIAELVQAIDTAKGDMANVIGYTEDQAVSSDFNHDERSCIVDVSASMLLNPHFVKLVAYYDNEWAYAVRMVDLILHMKAAESGGGQGGARAEEAMQQQK
ncbi:hypothetical protein B484DRAFT_238030 [Ochromonadaceae sp. CCMP2298]|nr:hypothetical protein B484DRAFT_238030 [Ochromonadaceae sp. CCMP2298]|mmetsp:Transcript_14766/g.33185  ORF Transcript_14766/g.33185 Transcript_14766/m.33185 type:complete len:363 (-) Transcript_14766:1031-2119(-)